jgi:RNA polymerase sigma factor (TIGR02999 family)
MSPPGEITRLIADWQRGDAAAENSLFELLYSRLHSIALQCLRGEPLQTIGATALVHEAYMRFKSAENLEVANRAHFLALAARVMRRILVDRARARCSMKRRGIKVQPECVEAHFASDSEAEQVLSVNRALDSLSRQSPRQAQLVEFRYFGGFSEEESAAALGISVRTARREWQVARTRLRMAIDGTPA